jgi:PPOX class probable F420-dependent enzyme
MRVGLDPAVRAFLEEPRFAVLATANADGTPQQSVMWYELRDGLIMMNTAAGRVKAHNLHRDRRISICIEDGYRFVTITGEAELVDDQAVAQADIKALAVRYHDAIRAEEMAARDFSRQHRITILLPVDRVVAHGFGE